MIRVAAVVIGIVIVFAIGVALGESLNDAGSGGGTQTLNRTLRPLPVAPAARETVTVTVQNP